jgi:hypothetical protein
MFRDFVMTVWFMTLMMMTSMLYVHRYDDMHKPFAPDSGAFMITWMFMMSSFAIFVVGFFHMLTT